MKKQKKRAGTIALLALLCGVISAFFTTACPAGSEDDSINQAEVIKALSAEKAKYETGIILALPSDAAVINGVVSLIPGAVANSDITRSIILTSDGRMSLEEGKLIFRSVEEGTERTNEASGDGAGDADKNEVSWRTTMRDRNIQVVTLQFEKGGLTSTLNVLVAFKENGEDITVQDGETLGYGYNTVSNQVMKPVLDLKKVKAAGWIGSEGRLIDSGAEPLAMLAAQSFADDIKNKTLAEIRTGYGTHLIVKSNASSSGTVADADLVSLDKLVESVKAMYSGNTKEDANRQSSYPASGWVSHIGVDVKSNYEPSIFYKPGHHIVTQIFTQKQWRSEDWQHWSRLPAPEDLNYWAGGKYLYGTFQLSDTPREAIADLVVIQGKNTPTPAGYTKIDVDLNKGCGAGSPYLYLCYRPVNKSDTEAVAWIGVILSFSGINSKLPSGSTSLQWWGTTAERDSVEWVKFKDETNENKPADLNKGVALSLYVYLTMEKKPFKWVD